MADYLELAAAAQILRNRADDLGRVHSVLKNNAESARWQCAKADRYRSAIDARSLDMVRVQALMVDLAQSLAITSSILFVEHQASQPVIDNTK
jgi:hypothetical protein